MNAYYLLKIVCRTLLPFTLLYGFYVILNGDLSPGGGFQGGVLLSTSFLLVYFIKEDHALHFYELIKLEKLLFAIFIVFSFLLLVAYIPLYSWIDQRLILIALNFLIGSKVTIGLCGIMLIFIEEGSV